MPKDLDDLIGRLAAERAYARDIAKLMASVRTLQRSADERVENAARELREEVRQRVDAIDPPQDGDRVY